MRVRHALRHAARIRIGTWLVCGITHDGPLVCAETRDGTEHENAKRKRFVHTKSISEAVRLLRRCSYAPRTSRTGSFLVTSVPTFLSLTSARAFPCAFAFLFLVLRAGLRLPPFSSCFRGPLRIVCKVPRIRFLALAHTTLATGACRPLGIVRKVSGVVLFSLAASAFRCYLTLFLRTHGRKTTM